MYPQPAQVGALKSVQKFDSGGTLWDRRPDISKIAGCVAQQSSGTSTIHWKAATIRRTSCKWECSGQASSRTSKAGKAEVDGARE